MSYTTIIIISLLLALLQTSPSNNKTKVENKKEVIKKEVIPAPKNETLPNGMTDDDYL